MVGGAGFAAIYLPTEDLAGAITGAVVGFLAPIGWTETREALDRRGNMKDALETGGPVSGRDSRLAGLLDPSGTVSDVSFSTTPDVPLATIPDVSRAVEGAHAYEERVRERLVSTLKGEQSGSRFLLVAEQAVVAHRTAQGILMGVRDDLAQQSIEIDILVPRRPPDSEALRTVLRLDPFPFDGPLVLWLDPLDAFLRPGACLTVGDVTRVTEHGSLVAILGAIDRAAFEAAARSPEARELLNSCSLTFVEQPATEAGS